MVKVHWLGAWGLVMATGCAAVGGASPAPDPDTDADTGAGDAADATDDETTASEGGGDDRAGDGTAADTGSETAGEVTDCPEPAVAPQLEPDAPDLYCPPGAVLDRAYLLCIDDGRALGPFTPAMAEDCEACGGPGCSEASWDGYLARGLRGTTACPPGASLQDTALCVDETHAWGPFTPAMVAACEQAGGGGACDTLRWDRTFAESLVAVDPAPATLPWSYILPEDFGVRDDAYGGGHFGAPRSGNPGGHSGIDFLAPLQTPLLAPCDGPVLAGYANGYGNYVQLACPIPEAVARGDNLFASLFFAHLDSIAVDSGSTVAAGQVVGAVGKTGNASAGPINAHVHFEIAMHGSENEALSETHASANHAPNAAGDAFATRIAAACWDPHSFASLTGPTVKGRRPDPFMVLACLASKPDLVDPPAQLQAVRPWSLHYEASFDVDVGL